MAQGAQAALGNTSSLSAKVMRATEQQLLNRTVRATQYAVSPLPVDLASPSHLCTIVTSTPAKQLLNLHTAYSQGQPQALQAIRQIQHYGTLRLGEEKKGEMLEQFESFVNDPYLKKFLYQDVINEDYAALLQDLADYYNLTTEFIASLDPARIRTENPEDVFVETTLNYLKRHPHKVTVQLREILKNPEVGPRFKNSINWIISRPPHFLEQHEENFVFWLRSAYREHARSLTSACQAQEVRITTGFYKQALEELTAFENTHHRVPRWDGPMDERRLYNQLFVIMSDNQSNFFTEVTESIQAIQRILDAYPVITQSWEETFAQLEQFVKQHGFYPRSYDKTNGNTTEEELRLRDHIHYYTFKNPLRFHDIERLGEKYNFPF